MENDDWLATSAIYNDDASSDDTTQLRVFPDGTSLGVIRLHMLLPANAVYVEKDLPFHMDDPSFWFGQLEQEQDSPLVELQFSYSCEHELVSAGVFFAEYPSFWPIAAQRDWLEWLSEHAHRVLNGEQEQRMSYAVCSFVEQKGFDFFVRSEHNGIDIIASVDYNVDQRKGGNNRYPLHFFDHLIWRERFDGMESKLTSFFEIRQAILSCWRDWVTVSCPICFDEGIPQALAWESAKDCGHLFCRDCIQMYSHGIVEELQLQTTNPFKCPLPSCRQPMPIESCVLKLVDPDKAAIVRKWQKDVHYPQSRTLPLCPLRKCSARGEMRKRTLDTSIVFCEACGVTFCELCLQKITGEHAPDDCDTALVLTICDRYRVAPTKIKRKCEERWPWIKTYAAARSSDEDFAQWVQGNASQCPKCSTAIERIEGCFHMNCRVCGTHFCYECGDELFAPFYGTHHCWEERRNGQNGLQEGGDALLAEFDWFFDFLR